MARMKKYLSGLMLSVFLVLASVATGIPFIAKWGVERSINLSHYHTDTAYVYNTPVMVLAGFYATTCGLVVDISPDHRFYTIAFHPRRDRSEEIRAVVPGSHLLRLNPESWPKFCKNY